MCDALAMNDRSRKSGALLLSLVMAVGVGCDPTPPAISAPPNAAQTAAEATDDRSGAGPVPASWVAPRVQAARERLSSSEAGQRVWRAIEAHGGLTPWLTAGTLEFEFDYAPLGNAAGRKNTFQRVDLWSSRAHHRQINGPAEFGFDGESSWMKPGANAFSPSARFWSLTPYYFVGMPFVLADPGVRLEELGPVTLDDVACHMVKASYEPGTGDSPDDYYIVYLADDTNRLVALRYIVSFPGMFAPGEHSPEKLMRYGDFADVSGLSLATTFHTFAFNGDTQLPAAKVTDVRASRYRLGQRYDESIFTAPDGAYVEPVPVH